MNEGSLSESNGNSQNRNNVNDTHEDTEREHIEQEVFNEDFDHNSWTAIAPMSELPTDIFKKNSLSSQVRKTILQSEPKNKDIIFSP